MAISDALRARLASFAPAGSTPRAGSPRASGESGERAEGVSAEGPSAECGSQGSALAEGPDGCAGAPPLLDAHGPTMEGVLARMRMLAEGNRSASPVSAAGRELAGLIQQLRTNVVAAEREVRAVVASEAPASVERRRRDAGPDALGQAASAMGTMQRLMSAIARARAIEGNLAGAESELDAISEAEERLLLARAESLLAEGIARYTRTPTRPRARQLLN